MDVEGLTVTCLSNAMAAVITSDWPQRVRAAFQMGRRLEFDFVSILYQHFSLLEHSKLQNPRISWAPVQRVKRCLCYASSEFAFWLPVQSVWNMQIR